jgi:hypothetical protein
MRLRARDIYVSSLYRMHTFIVEQWPAVMLLSRTADCGYKMQNGINEFILYYDSTPILKMITSRPAAAAIRGIFFCVIKSKSRTYSGREATVNVVGWACI